MNFAHQQPVGKKKTLLILPPTCNASDDEIELFNKDLKKLQTYMLGKYKHSDG